MELSRARLVEASAESPEVGIAIGHCERHRHGLICLGVCLVYLFTYFVGSRRRKRHHTNINIVFSFGRYSTLTACTEISQVTYNIAMTMWKKIKS